ncbi:hypothetical protein EDB19DRAFT_1646337, partial [Suillus lakei]
MHVTIFLVLISFLEYTPSIAIQQHVDEPANSSLLHIGLLGCSPLQPTIAIRLQCLELYHQIQRFQSLFSIQAFTKVLCTLHNVHLSFIILIIHSHNALVVFDVYLNILRCVCLCIDQSLDRDHENWPMSGACPCCTFEVSLKSPILIPRRLHCMDGNFSAKRLDGSGMSDPRIFRSHYFIPQADVEHFKDDVCNNCSAPQTTVSCTENWTAAKAVEENKIVVFDQMGIFLVASHHGLIECVTEMARSGELAKYGLAAVNKVLDVCGNDQAIGHDIVCSSRKTIAASSIGYKAEELHLQLVVNAFHGFSH